MVAALNLPVPACELCAVYSATSARDDAGSGWLFTVAEQFVSANTEQLNGRVFIGPTFFTRAYVNSSYTHLVPSYNFSSRLGLSLNAPLIHRDFRRTESIPRESLIDESGSLTGFGDVALIGRLSLYQKVEMKRAININLLAGVKLPTGDTARLDAEVDAVRQHQDRFPEPGLQHVTIGGVHQHELSLGSGSFDGVFGLTSTFRWKRFFLNNQIQYYLRTEARGYEFGDLIIVSGGPAAYLLLNDSYSLSLQANTFYETSARDKILGQTFDQTGMTVWYFGPILTLTAGEHFSANAGVEIPLHIANNGLQTVPDYRIRGGFTWRF
ncbi:MAG: hypothetical protein EPO07_01075 [Verrucomicrobia bacterium]|nr:MAG: hypothetical protein EPO07_01075 [Verrucomicrobiota bacterium]